MIPSKPFIKNGVIPIMNAFTIKDLENLTGIKAHTIRIWEQRYSFLKPQRTDTNIRYYNNEELKKILNISLLNKYGFKISQIDKMSETDITGKIISINNFEAQQENVINVLIQSMVDMAIEDFEHHLEVYIANKGIEKTINQIIFPFMEKIGVLWITGHINPAQEHYISNLIRQKIIVGIDRITTRPGIQARKILLYLPQLELHEMGLLYAHYLSKLRGHQCFYLGQSVPLEDLTAICKQLKPDQILSIYTAPNAEIDLNEYLRACAQQIPDIPFLISGRMVVGGEYALKIPSTQFTVFEDFTALKRLL